jgi:hypothetical protein
VSRESSIHSVISSSSPFKKSMMPIGASGRNWPRARA